MFYKIKADVFVAAAEEGYADGVLVHRGVDEKGNAVWAMYHPQVGTVGCHDKFGEIVAMLEENPYVHHAPMRKWTNASRQHYGFLQLLETEILEHLTERTRPDFDASAEAERSCINQDWVTFIKDHLQKDLGGGQAL